MRIAFALLLFAVLLQAPTLPAHGGEPKPQAPPVGPAEVARLLLSPDEAERERGAGLLLGRIRQGGDAAAFIAAMAKEQSKWADAEDRLIDRWIDDALNGSPARQERARRLLAALGPKGTRRLLAALQEARASKDQPGMPQGAVPDAAAPAVPPVASAPPETTADPQPAAGRAFGAVPPLEREPQVALPIEPLMFVPVSWTVLEVPTEEILHRPEAQGDEGSSPVLGPLSLLEAVVFDDASHERVAYATGLPEARVRGKRPTHMLVLGRATTLVAGEEVSYRSRVRPTKGAWAIDTDVLHRGLGVDLLIEPADEGYAVTVEARHTYVPRPLPTERVRAANDVEPVVLDRPEWESAALTLSAKLTKEKDSIVAYFPGLVPDRVVIVFVRIPGPLPVLER